MIRSLRIRFIRIAVLAVALVLFLIIGSINLLNYRNVAREADTILGILQENDGHFPQGRPVLDMPVPDGETDHAMPDRETDHAAQDAKLPRRGRTGPFRFDPEQALSEETPFESRYFSVTLDDTGTICGYDISSIASVEESDLEELVQTVTASRKQNGFWNQYRYVQYETDGLTTLLFLDCSRSLYNARSFLLASILVSLLGLAGVLLLIILFSGRVVRPVQESYEKQKRFITDAGHELKTPLTIIDADVSVAEMESGPSEWLDDIKSQTRRLAGLTGDLIYLSRMDEGGAKMQRVDFPVSEVISDIVQSFRARVQVEEKTLTADIEPFLSLYGDEKSITKLVTILLDNAVKYAKEKGTISVSLHKKARNLELMVQNDAESVDPASLPHFFDRFYRADASRNSSRGGYGIGLSIAQAVVNAHKGKIAASLPEENLLRITVTLPVS